MPKKEVFEPRLASFKEMIDNAVERVGVLPGSYYTKLPSQLRDVAFTVSNIESVSSVDTILKSLNGALKDGTSFVEWRKTFDKEALGLVSKHRARVVYRNFMQQSYNQGKREFALARKKVFPYLKYVAILDDVVRPTHEAQNGTIRPVEDPYWDTFLPPIGHNCRCEVIPFSKRKADSEGGVTKKSDLDKQVKENKPDKGWSNNKVNPTRGLTGYFQKKVKRVLKGKLATKALNSIKNRKKRTELFMQRNKDAFAKPNT